MKLNIVILLTTITLFSISCTRQGSQVSSISMSIPAHQQKEIGSSQSKIGSKVSTLTVASELTHISINVTNGANPPVVFTWDGCTECNPKPAIPTEFKFDVPMGDNRLVQVLAVYQSTVDQNQDIFYGDTTVNLNQSQMNVPVLVTSILSNVILEEGRVQGRYLTSTSDGPTGRLLIKYAPLNKTPMTIMTSKMVSGWFNFMVLKGINFTYQLETPTGLLNLDPFTNLNLDSTSLNPSESIVKMKVPPYKSANSNYGGGESSPINLIVGFWGPGSTANKICTDTTPTPMTNIVQYVSSGIISWSPNTPYSLGDISVYGGITGGTTSTGICANMTNQYSQFLTVDHHRFDSGQGVRDGAFGFVVPFQNVNWTENGGYKERLAHVTKSPDNLTDQIEFRLLPGTSQFIDTLRMYKYVGTNNNFHFNDDIPCGALSQNMLTDFNLIGTTGVTSAGSAVFQISDSLVSNYPMLVVCTSSANANLQTGIQFNYGQISNGGPGPGPITSSTNPNYINLNIYGWTKKDLCYPGSVQLVNVTSGSMGSFYNNAMAPTNLTVNWTLGDKVGIPASSIHLYSDPSCTNIIASPSIISQGQSNFNFYFKHSYTDGTQILNFGFNVINSSNIMIASNSYQTGINTNSANPIAALRINRSWDNMQNNTAPTCFHFTSQFRDANGDTTGILTNSNLILDSKNNGSFYTQAGCSSGLVSAGSMTAPSSSTQVDFYFAPTNPTSIQVIPISATINGISGNYSLALNSQLPIDHFNFNNCSGGSCDLVRNVCKPIQIQVSNINDEPAVDWSTTLNPTWSSASNIKLFNSLASCQCGNPSICSTNLSSPFNLNGQTTIYALSTGAALTSASFNLSVTYGTSTINGSYVSKVQGSKYLRYEGNVISGGPNNTNPVLSSNMCYGFYLNSYMPIINGGIPTAVSATTSISGLNTANFNYYNSELDCYQNANVLSNPTLTINGGYSQSPMYYLKPITTGTNFSLTINSISGDLDLGYSGKQSVDVVNSGLTITSATNYLLTSGTLSGSCDSVKGSVSLKTSDWSSLPSGIPCTSGSWSYIIDPTTYNSLQNGRIVIFAEQYLNAITYRAAKPIVIPPFIDFASGTTDAGGFDLYCFTSPSAQLYLNNSFALLSGCTNLPVHVTADFLSPGGLTPLSTAKSTLSANMPYTVMLTHGGSTRFSMITATNGASLFGSGSLLSVTSPSYVQAQVTAFISGSCSLVDGNVNLTMNSASPDIAPCYGGFWYKDLSTMFTTLGITSPSPFSVQISQNNQKPISMMGIKSTIASPTLNSLFASSGTTTADITGGAGYQEFTDALYAYDNLADKIIVLGGYRSTNAVLNLKKYYLNVSSGTLNSNLDLFTAGNDEYPVGIRSFSFGGPAPKYAIASNYYNTTNLTHYFKVRLLDEAAPATSPNDSSVAGIPMAMTDDYNSRVLVAGVNNSAQQDQIIIAAYAITVGSFINLDNSFGLGGSVTIGTLLGPTSLHYRITSIQKAQYSDGYFIAGGFEQNSINMGFILKIYSNGQLDTSYNFTGFKVFDKVGGVSLNNEAVSSFKFDSNNNLVVAITESNVTSGTNTHIARFLYNGSRDISWMNAAAPTAAYVHLTQFFANKLFIGTGNQILVSGTDFSQLQSQGSITKIRPDGVIDPLFNSGVRFSFKAALGGPFLGTGAFIRETPPSSSLFVTGSQNNSPSAITPWSTSSAIQGLMSINFQW